MHSWSDDSVPGNYSKQSSIFIIVNANVNFRQRIGTQIPFSQLGEYTVMLVLRVKKVNRARDFAFSYLLYNVLSLSPLGQYACKEGKNSPCLVYVSFNHKIYVYWRVELERMEPSNLLSVLEERPEYTALLQTLGAGKWTTLYVF